MSIDYNALDKVIGGGNTEDPLLGATEIDPQSGLTLSEEGAKSLQSHLAYGNPINIYPGPVDKATLRILGEDGYYPQHGDEYTRYQLARKQSSFGQLTNAMNQAIVGEIIGGTIEGIGYMLDGQQYANLIKGEEEEFGNTLSDVGKSLKAWTREVGPVNVSPGAKEYDPGNWSWWMSNFPSVASTLSLMIPSAGVVRGVGALAKLAGVAKGMGRTGKWMATGISQAVVSRHMENLMEASQVYKEEFDRAKTMNMSEDEAKKFASVAASNTYAKQWWMLAQDIPQYLLLNRLGGMGKQATSMKVAKAMGIDPGKTIATKTATILRDMVGEGGEEMFQYLVNEQSSLLAQRTIDPNVQTSMSKVWQDKYDSGEMWTAATFGALGAGVMQAGFAGFNAKAIQASNKARIAELQGRGQVFKQAYEEYQNAVNSGDPIRTRQALANLEVSLAINAEAAGNEGDLISSLDKMTSDPNDEIFERYGIDPQQGTVLKDNPQIAENIKATVRRVKELKRSFERENNLNKNIKGEQKKQEFAHLMTWNQLMLEKTKAERETLEQEMNDMSASAEKLNALTPQGKLIKELEGQILAIKNSESEIGSEDPYKKPGVIDVLEHRLKTQGNNMEELEKALFEYNIELQKRDLVKTQAELKQAQEEYTEELQTQDKEIAVTDDELVPLMSHKLRIKWVDAAINDLNKRMENYRAGTPLRDETAPVEDKKEDAEEEKYDPEVDVHVNDVVSYIDDKGNVQKGRVLEVDIATVDSEGTPIGTEGDNAGNVYRIQPLDKDGKPDGSPVVKSGLDVALDKEARVTEDTSTTIDTVDEDTQIEIGIAGLKDNKSNQGTLTPVLNLSYSQFEEGNFVIRNKKLGTVLSDPNTSYDGSESELSTDLTNPYLKTIRARAKSRIKLLEESGENKKELGAQRRMLTLVNKLIKGYYLTKKEVDDFITASKKTPIGNALDQMPISVGVTIEGVEYKDGLFMHSANFEYIKIPTKILRKMQKDPEAKKIYIAKKMQEARSLRNAILRYTLTGTTLYGQGLKVGRGSPNTLPKTLSINERKRNIATALGVKPDDIKFAVAKAQAANPYYSTMWSGENTRIPGVRFGSEGNMFVITNQTVNGKNYALKINMSKIHREHADILLDAFRLVGIVENEKKGKAWRKYKTDGKVNKNAKYSFKWAKQYDKVSGILPAETIDLLVAHGKELTDPNSASFKTRLRNEKHRAALLQKTLYLETTKSKAVLYYGYNSETEAPFEINLLESKSINEHRIPFIEWASTNKNYASHISKRSLGLEINGGMLEKRPFVIGAVNKLERKAGDGYNAFLINNMMTTTDVERREDNGLIFGNPILNLNAVDAKGQLNLTTKTPEVTETEVIKKEQPKPKAEPAKSEPQKQEEKKPKVETTEELDKQVKKLESELEGWLAMTSDPAEKKKLKSKYKYRIDKLKILHAAAKEEKAEEKKGKDPLADIDSKHKIAMEATEEEPAKKINLEKELAWVTNKVNLKDVEVVSRLLKIAGTGRRAYALYGHDSTLLYEGAAEGALYHEAWHRVSLGYLTKAEREALYRTARQVYKMEDSTDRQIEERLAEEFREFVLFQDRKDKPTQHTGIRRVFQRIYDWIKSVFAGPSRLRENDVDRMFQQIYAGKYSESTVLEANIDNITPGEYAMAVGRHKLETITSSKHRNDVVKMLADKTLQLNEIEDLNSLRGKDRIKAEPFFE